MTEMAAERHEVVGAAVARAIRAALDSLQNDMTCTSKVLAAVELRAALELLERERADAP